MQRSDGAAQRTLRRLVSASNLVFDVDVCGVPGMPMVLLLHGFPQTSYMWRQTLPALADAGFWAVAPNQRGYSPGARPAAISDYATDHLVGDALQIAGELGAERFHVVGHDWGGQIAWMIAGRHPEHARSLSVLSRPHPAAFAEAMRADPGQARRSKHHREFQNPAAARLLLENGAERLRAAFEGVPATNVDAYLDQLGSEDALDAALNWYRVRGPDVSPLADRDLPAVSVPTLYLWGDADAAVGRTAAEGTARHVTGQYRFEVVAGAGHFLIDQAGTLITDALLSHIKHHS